MSMTLVTLVLVALVAASARRSVVDRVRARSVRAATRRVSSR